MAGIWDRHFLAADAADRTVKLPKCLFDDPRTDFRRQAAAAPAFVHDYRPPSFSHRSHDCCVIERPQAAQVDDLRIDIFTSERRGCVKRLPQGAAIRDERNVFPRPAHHRLVDVDSTGVRRELADHVVEHDILENQHRVRVL